jgi:hypothetical protein
MVVPFTACGVNRDAVPRVTGEIGSACSAGDATSSIEFGYRPGEKSSPDSGDVFGYADRVQPVPGRDGAMTDVSAAVGSGRAPSTARPGLIDRHDLVAALDHAAETKATVISAPVGSGKTSLLRVWAVRIRTAGSPSCRGGPASMTREDRPGAP